MVYLKNVYGVDTPQSEALPDRDDMVENSAGGFVFGVDPWQRLQRFLILGSEGGTYYVGERPLTLENAAHIKSLIAEDGPRVVDEVFTISGQNRAPKNDPAIFVLAMCTAFGDKATRDAVLDVFTVVVRTGTHLFQFVDFVDSMRGWGRGLKKIVSRWYLSKTPKQVAYQVLKYRDRHGWTHRDILRKAHVKSDALNSIFAYIAGGEIPNDVELEQVRGMELAKQAEGDDLLQLIRLYRLTREMILSEHLANPDVMRVLLKDMPATAMLRNLSNLGRLGILKPLSSEVDFVVNRITDPEWLRAGRIHPVSVLAAQRVYSTGRSSRDSTKTWDASPQIVEALDKALDLSFAQVEPTNQRFYLGLDVSASMGWGHITGIKSLNPREAGSVMALVMAKREPKHYIAGFTGEMVPLNITARDTVDSTIAKTRNLSFGRTDCAQPMLDALNKNLDVDCFVIITDNETWAGSIHPSEALKKYRRRTGINAKLAVVAMTSTGFTIADPTDSGMLDVVGFDANVPQIIREHCLGF